MVTSEPLVRNPCRWVPRISQEGIEAVLNFYNFQKTDQNDRSVAYCCNGQMVVLIPPEPETDGFYRPTFACNSRDRMRGFMANMRENGFWTTTRRGKSQSILPPYISA